MASCEQPLTAKKTHGGEGQQIWDCMSSATPGLAHSRSSHEDFDLLVSPMPSATRRIADHSMRTRSSLPENRSQYSSTFAACIQAAAIRRAKRPAKLEPLPRVAIVNEARRRGARLR
jgi:hypothetical protein